MLIKDYILTSRGVVSRQESPLDMVQSKSDEFMEAY